MHKKIDDSELVISSAPPFPGFMSILLFALSYPLARLRFFWYVRILSGLRKFANNSSDVAGIDYSGAAFKRIGLDNRIYWTMFALCAAPDLRKDSLLILGPRFETEIFLARAIGFNRKNIVAIDTYSYSPLIQQGDMHDLPLQDEAVSAVICGWTLSYSTNPTRAASEMTRVLKPGGYLVLAVQKISPDFVETIPGVLSGNKRIQTLTQFDQLFSSLERVMGFEPTNVHESSHTLVCYHKQDNIDS